ncbi:Adenylosuccinate synthetase [Mesoplasma florum W37]|uniref:Adenylosuccinate synthetase n=1 Tax=Mesoplasma florum TaxID=2151 RepID=A0AAD0MN23_MESFO|nr:adenylosuccinate synthase [Mesoplasma florum]AGY41145.1 Adenylosuccinate synthetase [Mesoplasma florum W37]AVN59376.1 adenylosuccinate synthase [Mesoplasma florum]AVN65483.1 Adenylosuccinate synthetase [Mesoplasma florum]
MREINSLVVVGSQWGDEGKGKMTDYFAQKADVVVRFAGGDNAGHVINFNGQKHKVTIIPSGIFNSEVTSVIGNGCAVNLINLVKELETIKNSGVKLGKLLISDRAQLILPYHILIDGAQEESRGARKIGTTKRGIGPTYQDKAARLGIRVADIEEEDFKETFKEIFEYQMMFLDRMFNVESINFEETYANLINAYSVIKDCVTDTGIFIEQAIKNGKKVLFEGAQGALLDIDHGTYPYVTSSNTSANNASTGTGISHKLINNTLGVVKAYSTRVGAGAFPTELLNEVGDGIRERGHEYGSNTKRPRRVGWLDLVALKHAIRTSGIDYLFITLLDVLSGVEELLICDKYILNGEEINYIPVTSSKHEKCKANYISMPGWKEDITKVKHFEELPLNAKNYLNKIAEICEVEITGFSVGPDRLQTVITKEIM